MTARRVGEAAAAAALFNAILVRARRLELRLDVGGSIPVAERVAAALVVARPFAPKVLKGLPGHESTSRPAQRKTA